MDRYTIAGNCDIENRTIRHNFVSSDSDRAPTFTDGDELEFSRSICPKRGHFVLARRIDGIISMFEVVERKGDLRLRPVQGAGRKLECMKVWTVLGVCIKRTTNFVV